MIRKGRKPTPQSEEERLQQEKEKEESQLRKAANRNAAKRAKREPKFNMGPVLGHAKELTEKSVTNNQERQLKQQAQQSSHKTQPQYNTKSSSSAGNEDLDCLPDPEGMDQARMDHSYANENTVNSSVFDQGSKENAIQQLREKLKELMIASELEANQAIADSVSPEIKEKKKRKSEEKDLDCLWTDVESLAFKAFEHHHGIRGFSCKNCGDQSNQIINCLDCSEKLCGKCDEKIHLRIPFHQRSFYSNTRPGKQLLPTEFVDHQGQIVVKSVFIPLCSPKCDKRDTHMSQIARYPFHAVVTPKGRFDLNRTIFHCDNCSTNREADFTDFITSGYFTGSPVSTKYLFSFDLLRLWRHLKYLTPGTSEYKFLETVMAISADLGRRGTINKKLFNKASKLYEYFNSLLDEKKGKAWFGDKLIVSSENAKKVKDEINLVRPPGKNTISSKCGNSQFLAAREVSTKYKKLEATGIVMASCGHDVVHTAVEMREGETFRDTFAAHIKCRDFNAKFLINDVICQYWDFARNIEFLLPKYKYLTENMSSFLSYVHGQAHGWYCQVLYFGTGRKAHAVAGLKFYTARFQMLLDANQLTEEDLPSIQEELIKEAFEYKSRSKRKTTTDISTLQDELEWKDVVAEEVPQFLDDEEDDDEIQEDDDEMEEEEDEMQEEEDEMQEDEAEGLIAQ
ncbi:hypothetical protein OUZ56_003400 [Daphnia magna]|uniref:CxC3 like cysteine cluster domain-containing protein n=1 Tax=Daphnia magna TaxID=35525 RepID=A0ABR0A8L5_9CRUS|nr:hypothetical protein OUZ56_003400 [Daphnia magna]